MNILKIILLLILFLPLCCDPEPRGIPESPTANVVFVVTTDYSTGSYSTIGLNSLMPYNDLGMGKIHSDACARYFNGMVYIINRLNRDNIQILDPGSNFQTISETSTGSGSNPHDFVSVSSDKAYVTRYNTGELWIVNPDTAVKTGEIDLSEYAHPGASGIPRMDKMYFDSANNRVFVSLQRLDSGWAPDDYSSVIVIDTTTDSVIKEIVLQWDDGGTVSATNPYSHFRFVDSGIWQPSIPDGHDHLFISCTGFFGFFYQEDCGIVAIDLIDLDCEKGFVVSESIIHTEITDFVVKSSTIGYIVTSDENFHSSLARFNPQTGELTKIIREDTINLGNLWALALHSSGMLYVCDRRSTDPGVRIYDTNINDFPMNSDRPVDVGLPPFDIIFIE